MNISALFIRRPVATSLLAVAIALSGLLAYFRMPVAPLPNIAFPVIVVQANMAGASPEIMASTVAEPLERRLGTIADVSQLTSISNVGSSMIIIMFGLTRDINGAARDVEAAIQAARADLPTTLRNNPTYRQYNPASAPIMVLALTSDTLTKAQLYDSADSVIQQQLSQVDGVGQITLGGGALPSVRVELEPGRLTSYGIGLEDVRAAIGAANANSAKGHIDEGEQRYEVVSNDQISHAAPFRDVVIAYRNGAPVMLRDVAKVIDSNENIRNAGLYNGKSAVLVIVYPTPGSNVVKTVSQIRARLPAIEAALPGTIRVNVAIDRSESVSSSVADTSRTLFIAVLLVIGVVFVFLLSPRATLIPAVALPLSIVGTFGPMYLLGYSIDNLSLMALTIGTGFVVDDAVVVLENIVRHLEAGLEPKEAALRGSAEVGFTVISMSLSLIAVFLPILLMPGVVGLLFHEFAVTLSIAILLSLLVSLTITPTMCAYVLSRERLRRTDSRVGNWIDGLFTRFRDAYSRSLDTALDHAMLVIGTLIGLLVLNVFLLRFLSGTFFPEQDTGILIGQIIADQSISFPAMEKKLAQLQSIVQQDPAVDSVAGFTGGRALNTATVFISLKPLAQRHLSATEVVNRLRPKLNAVSGARLFLQAQQDLQIGGRQSAAEYQYTLTSDDASALFTWVPKLVTELGKYRGQLQDVNSDLQQNGLQTTVHMNRATAMRYGFQPNQIDNVLYDAFGQRTVSTIYNPINQYFVVMEVAPQYWQYPQTLDQVFFSTAAGNPGGTQQTRMPGGTVSGVQPPVAIAATQGATGGTNALNADAEANQQTNSISNSKGGNSSGSADSTAAETMVPLPAFATWSNSHTATQVNHQSGLVAGTISFNLPTGGSLSAVGPILDKAARDIGMPASIHGSFAGAAQAYAQSMQTVPLLIIASLAVVYIVLGVLYENTIHPLTILSTLPSAGIGATLAMLLFGTPFSVIAMIGVILLIGIVKKNGIMMVDVAIQLQRDERMDARRAIHEAAVIRLRPIMMTTAAAVLGAVPLALGLGQGASLRQPLGVTVMGGLIVSQVFTLYTTPVIYLYLDRLRARLARWSDRLPWNRRQDESA
ncbi:efflux RND transporter permease subunit [Paraburkholderia caballeronis]|uniref:Multidrug efflux pump n=1 Tax=Paraburkholderia caballeronis TaxID=416943 RepID=A0A1H7RHC9_9BURK|nr:efflux RND transporter permease subunit [Paraburkholderia caballeronis]PXW23036.1 multidrug efflux pump [Paraburkholderia caballeronis]PXW97700.1 multidrug efflux pump [Paraburkholderia caballeronis]RAJ94670.1 multidrug efflux pump [Paraburkholderia caballeronis]SEE81917.1 multidrug efflux pump [Paraburkholderia caballeronis]SEL59730.1 multidrug efflux pump [Paraburkholderia caballeronis]